MKRSNREHALSADAEAQAGDKSAKCGEVIRSTRSDAEYAGDEEGDVEGWFTPDYVCENTPGG